MHTANGYRQSQNACRSALAQRRSQRGVSGTTCACTSSVYILESIYCNATLGACCALQVHGTGTGQGAAASSVGSLRENAEGGRLTHFYSPFRHQSWRGSCLGARMTCFSGWQPQPTHRSRTTILQSASTMERAQTKASSSQILHPTYPSNHRGMRPSRRRRGRLLGSTQTLKRRKLIFKMLPGSES